MAEMLYSNSDRVFEQVSEWDSRLQLVMPWEHEEREERPLLDFPPRDTWLINPETDKFDTPVDDRGFVDIDKLIAAVKATVDPEYTCPTHTLNEHHVYWEEEWYHSRLIGANALRFRELAVHKMLVPVPFHNWLHRITIPADVPDPELIRSRNNSWTVANALFKASRNIVQLERLARRREALIERKPEILPVRYAGVDVIGRE